MSDRGEARPRAAVLTISDRCSAGKMKDTAGPAAASMLEIALGAEIAHTAILPDDRETIRRALTSLAGEGYDLILTAGGTGCGPRDITPEATRDVIEREIPGMAEAMRRASMKATPHAMLSRGVCGIRAATLIVNLPGSLKAATENLDTLVITLPHALRQIRGQSDHPESDRGRKLQGGGPQ